MNRSQTIARMPSILMKCGLKVYNDDGTFDLDFNEVWGKGALVRVTSSSTSVEGKIITRHTKIEEMICLKRIELN